MVFMWRLGTVGLRRAVVEVAERCKHSKRVIKKMNFIRAKRLGLPWKKPEPNPPPPAWKVEDLKELPNGWTPPPAEIPTHHPFAVLRSKASWLPVYSRYRQGKPYTLVRHVVGDVDAFAEALHKVTDVEPVKRLGTVEIKGHHVKYLRRWLTHLGF